MKMHINQCDVSMMTRHVNVNSIHVIQVTMFQIHVILVKKIVKKNCKKNKKIKKKKFVRNGIKVHTSVKIFNILVYSPLLLLSFPDRGSHKSLCIFKYNFHSKLIYSISCKIYFFWTLAVLPLNLRQTEIHMNTTTFRKHVILLINGNANHLSIILMMFNRWIKWPFLCRQFFPSARYPFEFLFLTYPYFLMCLCWLRQCGWLRYFSSWFSAYKRGSEHAHFSLHTYCINHNTININNRL